MIDGQGNKQMGGQIVESVGKMLGPVVDFFVFKSFYSLNTALNPL